MNLFEFQLLAEDSGARLGRLHTPHGIIQTPTFMPVGTAAAMKAMTTAQLEETNAQIVLSNTYHLNHQPGTDLIEKSGGIHSFMAWKKPILTDSGGYQVFSLPTKKIDENGVTFSYQKGGKQTRITPESCIHLQNQIGADIIMAFDECVEYPTTYRYAKNSLKKTIQWAKQCKQAHQKKEQALFGINQGATYKELRQESIKALIEINFPGYAIGGLSVGEGIDVMKKVLDFTTPLMLPNKPRYLMGIGLPQDIFAAVERGIDMCDCVIPTKYARSGVLFTHWGKIRITNKRFRKDQFPVDTNCSCYTCRNFSRSYLYHLFAANEILSSTLTSIHNVYFFNEMMRKIRDAIQRKSFLSFKNEFLQKYH